MTVKGFYDDMMGRHGEMIRYLIFGFLTTIISWGSYAVFVWCGIDPFWSNVFSWVCGVAFAFVTNKWIVFRSKSTDKKVLAYESGSFIIARVVTGVIAIVLFPVLYNVGLNQEVLGTDGLLAKIVTSVVEIIANWVLSKYLVFNKNISHRDD